VDDLLIVMSNPLGGRHAEFNDWYSHVHIRDVMRLPGASAVQRLRMTQRQVAAVPCVVPDRSFAYLAVYECDDIERVSAGHDVVFTPMMLISDSFDFTMREAYYRPLVHRQKAGARLHEGAYVVERFAQSAGTDFASWYDRERMPALMALPGVVSGTLATVADHQMLSPHPDSWFVGLYRTQNVEATVAAWCDAPCLSDTEALVSCYEPLIARLPAKDVVFPSAAGRLAEAKARVALGNKVYPGFPEGMATA
jgi:hypothetical protein